MIELEPKLSCEGIGFNRPFRTMLSLDKLEISKGIKVKFKLS